MRRKPLGWLLAASAAAFVLPQPSPLGASGSGSLVGKVTIYDEGKPLRDRSDVVVYLEGVPGAMRGVKREPMVVRQKNKQFHPQVGVVVKGTRVQFPNMDKIFHNVFSTSRPARFDLGLYRSGTSKEVEFRRPGMVDIFCNIHPQMMARILVVDTKYYDETGRQGRFRIRDIPAGTYSVVAWQAYGKSYRGKVTIKPGASARLKVRLEKGEKPRKHRRKDGTPYGRYE